MRVENHHTQELSIPAGDVINLFTRQVVNLGLKECIHHGTKAMSRQLNAHLLTTHGMFNQIVTRHTFQQRLHSTTGGGKLIILHWQVHENYQAHWACFQSTKI